MKIVFINSVCGIGSTGRICVELAQKLESEGNEVKIAFGRQNNVSKKYEKYAIRIGNSIDYNFHAIKTRLLDTHGFESKKATKNFLEWLEDYNPDILWLHNLHGYYINIEMLFEWIKKKPNIEVKWTLHDCWAFTGHCSYFSMVKCNQWEEKCSSCIQLKKYPSCYGISSVSSNFERKKSAFTGVKNMKLITPSKWLADLTKRSFLKDYPVEVQYNDIDRETFKPTNSDFRKLYDLNDKIIVLGVASVWEERKGLLDFYKLRKLLGDRYIIVLVGLNKRQSKKLPSGIISINKTESAKKLAEIYTSADILVNPTYEDNYPTVNLEAQACGTQVLTYKTGGSPESVPEENVFEVGDIYSIYKRILCIGGK